MDLLDAYALLEGLLEDFEVADVVIQALVDEGSKIDEWPVKETARIYEIANMFSPLTALHVDMSIFGGYYRLLALGAGQNGQFAQEVIVRLQSTVLGIDHVYSDNARTRAGSYRFTLDLCRYHYHI